ncbi:MAG: PD-(D/E)XK nuclease family protein [Synergistaceae bacterium]|nr:PD-(D/E)XK nuclease family protein [Synergistaceae bacterium]
MKTYYYISECAETFAKFYDTNGENGIFIIPSALDKEQMLRLVSRDGSFFGPRPQILTLGELYRKLAEAADVAPRRVIDPPDHSLIISYVLSQYLEDARTNGLELPAGVAHAGFVSVLGDNIKNMLAEDVTPKYLKEKLAVDDDNEKPSPEAILFDNYARYIDYLDGNGIADAAQIPSLTCELLNVPEAAAFVKEHRFMIVGFLSFTGSQLKLIRALDDAAECSYVLPETGLDDFHDAIKQIGEDYSDRPKWDAKIAKLSASNTRLEYDSVARELALWASDGTHVDDEKESKLSLLGDLKDYGDVGILVPEGALPLLTHSLARYKIPYNVQVRGAVGKTLLGQLPRVIWSAYASGWGAKETAFMLADPLLRREPFAADKYAEKFLEGCDAWTKELPRTQRELFEKIGELCAKISNGGALSDILSVWRAFLRELDVAEVAATCAGENISADEVVKDITSALAELDKKINVLTDMSRDIGGASKVVFAGAKAIDALGDWARTATLPMQLSQSHSATIYAGPPPTLTTHRYWVMMDVDYNTWPGKLRESPLLSAENKKRLNGERGADALAPAPHIPELYEERAQKEALFRRLMATGRDGVIIARSTTDANGRPVGESQFVPNLLEQNDKDRKWRLAAEIEYTFSKALPNGGDVFFPEAEISVAEPRCDRGSFPRESEPSWRGELTISPSSIDDFVSCPYLYYCRHILKLQTPRVGIYDPMRGGNVLHDVWKAAIADYAAKPRSFALLAASYFDEMCREKYPELLTDARLRRHHDRLLKQATALAERLDYIEDNTKGKKLETKAEEGLPSYEIDGVKFKGRYDRLDIFDEGVVILDYKSNSAGKHRNDLQLAAYALMLMEREEQDILGYAWLGHADNSIFGYFRSDYRGMYVSKEKSETDKAKEEAQLTRNIELAKQTMTEMAEAVKSGIYRANYGAKYNGQSRCAKCEYLTICRRREAPFYEFEEDNEGGGDDE